MRPDSHCRVRSVGCGRRQQTRAESPCSSPYHNRLQPGDQLTQAGLQAALVPLHFLQRSVFQYLEYKQDAAWIMVTSTPSHILFLSAAKLPGCRDWRARGIPEHLLEPHWSGLHRCAACLELSSELWRVTWVLIQDLGFCFTVTHTFHTSLWQTGSISFKKEPKSIHLPDMQAWTYA